MNTSVPPCPKCGRGHLVPLSWGSEVYYMWVCTNQDCDYKVGHPNHTPNAVIHKGK